MSRTCSSQLKIIIIGCGMAGLCAAIEALRKEPESGVTLLDTGVRPGRKIYVTGNGRCNLTNDHQSAEDYRTSSGFIPDRLYQAGWNNEVSEFMRSVGVLTHARGEYVYPRTDQASTVAACLVREAQHLGAEIVTDCTATDCTRPDRDALFSVDAGKPGDHQHRKFDADRVILATGGMVSESYGCNGDGYRIASSFGHHITKIVPSLCPLISDDQFLSIAAGIRTAACVQLFADKDCTRPLCDASSGELQMTENGISGIPVYQISRYGTDGAYAAIDFLPELSDEAWEEACRSRLRNYSMQDTLGDFCLGLIPDRIAGWILAGLGLVREKKIRNLGEGQKESQIRILHSILRLMRRKVIHITGSADFEKAQTTAGGIVLSEVTDQMESVLVPGLYFAGEILDIDGKCGGYNLTWAIHSGRIAGRSAAESEFHGRKNYQNYP